MNKKYYLGLDIGTNSVGWAVTDENYNLYKYAGKRMWGIRLFEAADTAAERRMKRSNRRRLSRKKQRIDLLQELFSEEIVKKRIPIMLTSCENLRIINMENWQFATGKKRMEENCT